MGALPKTNAHVVNVLGNVIGRDQPIMRMDKAVEMISVVGKEVFLDDEVVFFDPFCKAGELLLSCAYIRCFFKMEKGRKLLDVDEIYSELFNSERYFGIAPDERHHKLSLRTFLGNENSHNEEFNRIIVNGNYLSEEDGRLDKEKYNTEFFKMIEFIKELTNKKKIVVVGNPPYQEADGGGNGKSAVPVYNLFTESLIDNQDISEFVLVIPSRWFAGGKGLDSFRDKVMNSGHIKKIVNFSNSSHVFPTVDINGGVCFLSYDKSKKYDEFMFKDGEVEENIDLAGFDIIPDDPLALRLMKKINKEWKGQWVGEVAMARNAFSILSNGYQGIPERKKQTGDLTCYFLRKQVRYIQASEVRKGCELVSKYKVVIPKAAGGSKGKRRSTIPLNSIFILNPNEICSETYSVVHSFDNKEEAENFKEYLKTDFARYLVGLRKITQNVSRGTWSWLPLISSKKITTEKELFKMFSLSKSDVENIKKKVKEWS